MTEENKQDTNLTHSATILCWLKEVRSKGGGRYQQCFKTTDEQWYSTYPSPNKDELEQLPGKFPRGAKIKFETCMMKFRGKEEMFVKLPSIKIIPDPSRPDQKTIEETAEKSDKVPESPDKFQSVPKEVPKKDMATVNRYNFDRNRSIVLNVIIKEACECVRGKDIPLEDQPEKIAEFVEKLDKALQDKFPELRPPQ
ncbi:hypothetical protein GF312_22270 [Candidatus Poribacteria bacterium]|nr:hypothetical protein [Candidatus Poribacteria bacterium]